jgi:hypothetical protein
MIGSNGTESTTDEGVPQPRPGDQPESAGTSEYGDAAASDDKSDYSRSDALELADLALQIKLTHAQSSRRSRRIRVAAGIVLLGVIAVGFLAAAAAFLTKTHSPDRWHFFGIAMFSLAAWMFLAGVLYSTRSKTEHHGEVTDLRQKLRDYRPPAGDRV